MTHEFTNRSSQAERKAVVKNDSYFSRQQNNVDDAGGRYAKLTPTNVIGSTALPTYPQLPPSSPWSSGFDQNLERPLGLSVEEMPANGTEQEIQSSLLALSPAPVAASPAVVEDRAEEEPAADVANLAASLAAGSSTSFKRRF